MDEILTPKQIAEILKIESVTVVRAMRAKKIPGAFKVSGHWRLRREDLDRYIDSLIKKANEKKA